MWDQDSQPSPPIAPEHSECKSTQPWTEETPRSTQVGQLGEDEHGKISPLLDFEPIVDMPLKRLDQITVQRDNGLTGRPNTVGFRSTAPSFKQLVANMDILPGGGFQTPKKRPNSFSINWVLAEPGRR